MKVIIVGGVAGGATAAARLRRVDENAEIIMIEKGPYVSFANCGLPYFISGDITKREALLLQTPEGFWSRYKVKVLVNTDVKEIDRTTKTIKIQSQKGAESLSYDKLLLSQGASPFSLPNIQGENVFSLRDVPDMDRIYNYLNGNPKTATIIGGGFIGLEMAEALAHRGLKVSVLERGPQIMPPLDPEFARMAQETLEKHGVNIYTNSEVNTYTNKQILLKNGVTFPADIVIVAAGVKPEADLAKKAGLQIGPMGGVMVDEYLFTSDPDILAVGDMVEVTHKVLNKKMRIPLAGPANRQGRVVGVNLTQGKKDKYMGSITSSVVKIMDMTSAQTGISENLAKREGLDVSSVTVHPRHHAGYYPGAKLLSLKLIFEKRSGRILGAQGFGEEGVEKRIDVIAMAIHQKASVFDLEGLDLCYAPPYSSANDPVNMASYVAINSINGFSPSIPAGEALELIQTGKYKILDVRDEQERNGGAIEGSLCIPVNQLRERLGELDKNAQWLVHCAVGYRGHLAVRILMQNNFNKVWNISGGYKSLGLLLPKKP